MGKGERIAIAFIGLLVAAFGAWLALDEFIRRGVNPDLAAGYAVIVFLAILGAFGLIAVRVRL